MLYGKRVTLRRGLVFPPDSSHDTLLGTGVTSRMLWFPCAISHLLTEMSSAERASAPKHFLGGRFSEQSSAQGGGDPSHGHCPPWARLGPCYAQRARLCCLCRSSQSRAEQPYHGPEPQARLATGSPLHCPGWAGAERG